MNKQVHIVSREKKISTHQFFTSRPTCRRTGNHIRHCRRRFAPGRGGWVRDGNQLEAFDHGAVQLGTARGRNRSCCSEAIFNIAATVAVVAFAGRGLGIALDAGDEADNIGWANWELVHAWEDSRFRGMSSD